MVAGESFWLGIRGKFVWLIGQLWNISVAGRALKWNDSRNSAEKRIKGRESDLGLNLQTQADGGITDSLLNLLTTQKTEGCQILFLYCMKVMMQRGGIHTMQKRVSSVRELCCQNLLALGSLWMGQEEHTKRSMFSLSLSIVGPWTNCFNTCHCFISEMSELFLKKMLENWKPSVVIAVLDTYMSLDLLDWTEHCRVMR